MPPLVTFVLPVFNGIPFLKMALEGIFAQTLSDWHLLAIDDGSCDDSHEFLQRQSDPRIRVIFNDHNLGLYATLNKAILMVDSLWVSIVHQDDHLKPQYLEELLDVVEQHPKAHAFWATYDTIGPQCEVYSVG